MDETAAGSTFLFFGFVTRKTVKERGQNINKQQPANEQSEQKDNQNINNILLLFPTFVFHIFAKDTDAPGESMPESVAACGAETRTWTPNAGVACLANVLLLADGGATLTLGLESVAYACFLELMVRWILRATSF